MRHSSSVHAEGRAGAHLKPATITGEMHGMVNVLAFLAQSKGRASYLIAHGMHALSLGRPDCDHMHVILEAAGASRHSL